MRRETWKSIVGYEELYEVSDKGRIKFLRKLRYPKSRIMKLGLGRDKKYIVVNLYKNGKYKYFRVHRLVAKMFVDNPNNLPHVLHIDGNSINNEGSNLKWGDDKENQLDRKRHGTDNSGEKNGMSKLKILDILNIRTFYASGNYTQKDLGKKYNISQSNISNIINNSSWNSLNIKQPNL